MIRKIQWIAMVVAAVLCAACDAHIDVPDTAVRPGHILCEDGTALSYAQYEQSGKRAIAVVFDTERREGTEGNGYAVLPVGHCSGGIRRQPRCRTRDVGRHRGIGREHEHLCAVRHKETASPMAEAVFDLWRYGQSAYIPSVAQMRLLYAVRETVNPVIERCGGHPLPLDEYDCWYWTSTEVSGQETAKAWLYSTGSGAMQETPKTQAHKLRPIITMNK